MSTVGSLSGGKLIEFFVLRLWHQRQAVESGQDKKSSRQHRTGAGTGAQEVAGTGRDAGHEIIRFESDRDSHAGNQRGRGAAAAGGSVRGLSVDPAGSRSADGGGRATGDGSEGRAEHELEARFADQHAGYRMSARHQGRSFYYLFQCHSYFLEFLTFCHIWPELFTLSSYLNLLII